MPQKRKPQTLEQRITQGVAKQQFTLDDWQTNPDVHLTCNFCEASLLVDYVQFGYQEMSRRFASFLFLHEKCTPILVTKSADMMLTPKEKRAG